jgi:hypothetical protein
LLHLKSKLQCFFVQRLAEGHSRFDDFIPHRYVASSHSGSFSHHNLWWFGIPNSRISQQLAAMLNISDSCITLPINANIGSGPLTSVVEFEVDDGLCSDVELGRN